MLFDRRTLLVGGSALVLAGCKAAKSPPAAPKFTANADLAALEKKAGGRLGVYILDTGSGRATGHRVDERFGHCSTFKLSLGAAALQMADHGKLKLGDSISYTKADLLGNSPVTTENLSKGAMTVEALARAAQVTSDNAAANLLMKHIGGPETLNAFWRSLGDTISRVDRFEPEMNYVGAGEVRDTSSPRAMAYSMAKFLTGDILSKESKAKLIAWMVNTETGKKRIRAGLPADWRAGDKTGTFDATGFANKCNDIAIIWPPGKAPLIVTAYYEADGFYEETRDQDQALLAEVGRIAAAWAKA